mmetsp:Transcript_18298/g.35842  ORF Transcript_18298/g.35842 Transcript_18298/m.35842 type:complete len:961 (-) Transcript_18298:201-3083(-)
MKFAKLLLVAACALSCQARSQHLNENFDRFVDDLEFLEEEPETEHYKSVEELQEEQAQTHAELNAAPVNPFVHLLEQDTIPVAKPAKGGHSVTVHATTPHAHEPDPLAVLQLLGNRQLYVPGLVRVMRNIHAALLVAHGPFLANDMAEASPAMKSEFGKLCKAETKDVFPSSFCTHMVDLFEGHAFKGLNIFSPKTMPVFVAALAESVPTQYTPNVPLADAYLKVKEFVDDKPLDLHAKKITKPQIAELDSRCSNEFEFAIKNGDVCHKILAIYNKYFSSYDEHLTAAVAHLKKEKPKWAGQMGSLLANGADHWLVEHMQEAVKGQEDVDVAFTSAILLAIHVNDMDTSPPVPFKLPCEHPSATEGACVVKAEHFQYHPCGAPLAPVAPHPCIPAPCGHALAPAPCTPCKDHLLGCHEEYGTAFYDYDDKGAYKLYHMTHHYGTSHAHLHSYVKNGIHYDKHGRPIKPKPTPKPTMKPTEKPTEKPTAAITARPTTKRPTTKPTTNPTNYPTEKPTAKPTHKPTTHHESVLEKAKKMCKKFKQGCPCGHPLAPALPTHCTPCHLHPLGCPCGHPAAPKPCQPCEQHVLGCGVQATAQVPCSCANMVFTHGEICPCSPAMVKQCMPPVGSHAHTSLMTHAHEAAKKAAAAVLKTGGTQTQANAAAAAAHAQHIANHAAAAAAKHIAKHAPHAVHPAAGKPATAKHIAAHVAHPAVSKTKHISGINKFDTRVDTVTPCLVSPPLCVHGKCVDKQAHHYVCICDHGWAGDNCHIPLSKAEYGKISQLAFDLPFFAFDVPFSAVHNEQMDSTVFESQIKMDLAKALKTTTDRFHIKGLAPSHDKKYTVVTLSVTPPTKKKDISEHKIGEMMHEMMFPKLAPALAQGIATRHLFTPGTGIHYKSKRHEESIKQLKDHLSQKKLSVSKASKGKGVKLATTKNAAPATAGSVFAVVVPLVLSIIWFW